MSSSLLAELKKTFIVRIALSYSFIMSGFIVNFLQLLTFIFVWPFNKLLYRKIIYYLSYSLYSSMSNFSRYTIILSQTKCINYWFFFKDVTSLSNWWCGTKLRIYASDEDAKMFGRENCFFVISKD